MFRECDAIKSLDLSEWDMSKVNYINGMGCVSLVDLNLNGWNTSKVNGLASMFWDNNSLLKLLELYK